MKKIVTLLVLLIGFIPTAMACKLCEEQQPKWLRGVIHGPGPQSAWDYVVMAVSIVIVLIVLYYSVKFLVKPEEKDASHVKYSILNQNDSSYGK